MYKYLSLSIYQAQMQLQQLYEHFFSDNGSGSCSESRCIYCFLVFRLTSTPWCPKCCSSTHPFVLAGHLILLEQILKYWVILQFCSQGMETEMPVNSLPFCIYCFSSLSGKSLQGWCRSLRKSMKDWRLSAPPPSPKGDQSCLTNLIQQTGWHRGGFSWSFLHQQCYLELGETPLVSSSQPLPWLADELPCVSVLPHLQPPQATQRTLLLSSSHAQPTLMRRDLTWRVFTFPLLTSIMPDFLSDFVF